MSDQKQIDFIEPYLIRRLRERREALYREIHAVNEMIAELCRRPELLQPLDELLKRLSPIVMVQYP